MEHIEYLVRSKNVFDGKNDFPRPLTFAVSGGKIVKILPYEYDLKNEYKSYKIYDFGEKLIMPSFIDAHTHIFQAAIADSDYVCSDLSMAKSKEECVQIIKKFAEAHPDYKRIRGTGWFVGNWDNDKLPNKYILDEVINDRPVYLQCADCHSYWLNSKALEEANIKPNKDLENGIIETFENGELTGMLIEPAACEPANEKYMEFSSEELKKIHIAFQDKLACYGISAVSEMFADDYNEDTYKRYDVLKSLDEEGLLKSNIFLYTKLFGYTEFSEYKKMKHHYNGDHVSIAGLKGFIDGVTETYTGLLLEPYEDKPDTNGYGLPLWPRDKMQQEIIAANKEGISVRLHCIADGSVRMALDMYEESKNQNIHSNVRNTIEHIENIHPDDIERFNKIGVIASMQPYHVTLSNGDKITRLGKERCKFEWPIRTLIEAGASMALGTDCPVVDINPFNTIYAAVTRRDENGKVMCQNPWESLDMSTVLKAYTSGSAYAYNVDEKMGTIEEGKIANFIILNDNLFDMDYNDIENNSVIAYFFEGKSIL